ncbi:Hypothetical protein CS829B_0530 [Chlamydia suis]|uniref:hypothetical protein n=1 Tax=Chlamydia suis TaxID=83559 RepID=UPI0009AFCDFC|nr:hypothetical protein [Chlamydia suis]SIU03072.1 Hypothetical protein CS829B_0530 [Chlamydia suis]
MKKTKKLQKIIASTVFQRNTPADALLSVGSQQVASFTKLSFNNPAKLTGVATPTRDTDVVPLQYLQTHYLSKNDPNPGYLPIQGGSMTGNINMGTHSIFNLKQPEAPNIQLPQDSEKPTDPREDAGFKDKPAAEQDQEIAAYNTKLAAYQKKIDDYNAAWQAFYSEAATVKYVQNIVKEITSNKDLDTAITSATKVEEKIDLAHKTLGIEITQNPDAPDPTTISNTGGNTTPSTGTTAPSTGTTDPDAPSYENLPSIIKSSLFVLTQSDNTLKGDLKMTNAQISNIKTPAESGEDKYAANVEYLNKKLQPPKRAFVSHTLPTSSSNPNSSSNSISLNSGYIPWISAPSGSSTTTEPDFKSSLADQCLQATQENLEIKTPGLLVLSVRGSWNGTTSGGSSGTTQAPGTFPLNLTVTPDSTTGGSGSSGSSTTTTTLTLPLTLHSGESVMLQLPITETSKVKIATNPQSSGGGGSGSTTAPTTLSSWSWEAALFPTDVTTVTTPTTPPTTPSPAPAPAPAP